LSNSRPLSEWSHCTFEKIFRETQRESKKIQDGLKLAVKLVIRATAKHRLTR